MKNKLFIIIIVLLIAILLFLSIFFSEKEEKFITEITYQQLVSKMDKKEKFVLYVKQDRCSACEEFNPTFLSVLRTYNLKVYSLYTDKLSSTDSESFYKLVEVSGTPTVLFIEDGKETMNKIEGVRTKDYVIKKFANAGYINK